MVTLVDAVQAPGQYTARFDAGGLPSGTYFYRLETPSATQARKMTLLR